VLRSLLIPGVGAVLAWVVWQHLPARQLERRVAGRAARIAVGLALAAGLVGVTLLTLRYATWHAHLFDLGSYDQKVWVASVQRDLTGVIAQTYRGGERFSPCGATRYWGICHFQPLYVIYALAYRLWPSPLLLLWSQALLVASGVIPFYLLTRKLLGSTAGVLGVMVYLLHPAVQFNALLDFRPDHVAIPFLFWAFWFAERNRPGLALVAAARGLALLRGRTYALPQDVSDCYLDVCRHRLVLSYEALADDVTPDAVPVIAPVEALPGFFVATGFSGHGFGIGPGAGRLMADLVAGDTPLVDPAPFRFERFADRSHPGPFALAT